MERPNRSYSDERLRNYDDTASVSFIRGSSHMDPMNRFALFTVALITIIAIGSQPRHGVNLSKSMKDVCVCVPARAGLMAKAALAKTQAASVELLKTTVRQ
jgi:hypothetical protein